MATVGVNGLTAIVSDFSEEICYTQDALSFSSTTGMSYSAIGRVVLSVQQWSLCAALET